MRSIESIVREYAASQDRMDRRRARKARRQEFWWNFALIALLGAILAGTVILWTTGRLF